MLWHKEHQNSLCTTCDWVVAVLLSLATLAALIGVYKAHFLAGGATFGTTSGSLSLLAFTVSLTLWSKHMHCCCEQCMKGK